MQRSNYLSTPLSPFSVEASPPCSPPPMATRKRNRDGVQLLNCKKRKETLFRKCHELTVKSGAGVCLVCIGPDGEIEAWPNHEKVKAMLTKHREKQAGKNKKEKHSYEESESEEKKKISAESLMSLWNEIDSKLETLDEKIKMQSSIQKASDFCDSRVNTSSGSFMELSGWESYGQPWVSSVQLNQPTQFIEESMAVSGDKDYSFITDNSAVNQTWESYGQPWVSSMAVPADKDYSFINENFAVNHVWEPEIEFLGAQDSTIDGEWNAGLLFGKRRLESPASMVKGMEFHRFHLGFGIHQFSEPFCNLFECDDENLKLYKEKGVTF